MTLGTRVRDIAINFALVNDELLATYLLYCMYLIIVFENRAAVYSLGASVRIWNELPRHFTSSLSLQSSENLSRLSVTTEISINMRT